MIDITQQEIKDCGECPYFKRDDKEKDIEGRISYNPNLFTYKCEKTGNVLFNVDKVKDNISNDNWLNLWASTRKSIFNIFIKEVTEDCPLKENNLAFTIKQIRQAGIDGEISNIDVEHLISILKEKYDYKNKNKQLYRKKCSSNGTC